MNARISKVIISVLLIILIFFNIFTQNVDMVKDIQSKGTISSDIILENGKTSLPLETNTRSGDCTFINVTPEVGLSGVRGDSFAWGDYNNDGYQDLLLKDHINGKSHLFKNNGPPDWDFSDVTEDVGLEGAGYAVWGDYNNDGFLDFFSVGHTNDNPDGSWDTLWMNNGPPDYTFTNMTGPAGNMNDGMPGLAAGWADYDRDGFLDLYIVNWRDLDNNRYPDVLYHNNGDGTFSDVTIEAGVHEGDEPYAGMGVNWGDYNNDGWPDIYVSNYLVTPNYLYENNMDGTFTDVAMEKNAAGDAPAGEYYGHTAGSSWADFDHDGDLDMWVSNLAHTTDPRGFYTDYSQMLRNDGPDNDYSFTDVRDETGIEKKPYMSEDELHFGIAWGDYDNDGDMDMFIPQVKNLDYAYSYFFENNGDGTFIDVSDDVGVRVWNTDGACWADYNNDGYIDLITEGKYPYENGSYEVRLFKNNGESGNRWLEVGLKASESNRASIGAKIKVSYEGITQMKEVEGGTAGHSYQHSLVQHFGFGGYEGTVDITVWWPSGREIFLPGIALDQKIIIREYDYDLLVSDISFSNSEPMVGEKVTINALIENVGNCHITSAEVKFFDGDINTEPLGIYNLNEISCGSSENAILQWDAMASSGIHSIIASIEEVVPGDEHTQNNVASNDITIRGPDLVVSQLSFSDENPQEGDVVTITAKIENQGNSEAESTTIKFFNGDVGTDLIDIVELYNIEAGFVSDAIILWDTTGKKGNNTITVFIETVEPTEGNNQNNVVSVNIEVGYEEVPSSPPQEGPINHIPVITEFSAEPTRVPMGGSSILTVHAEDADDDTLTYIFQATDGYISGTGNVVLWFAPEMKGVYGITVTVRDTKDAEATESIYIEVKANSPPNIQYFQVSTDRAYSNGIDIVVFTAEVNDEDGLGDIEWVRIDLSEIGGSPKQRMRDDGKAEDEKTGDGIYSYGAVIAEGIEPGEKIIKITVKDKSDEESTEEIKILVLSTEDEESEEFTWPIPILLVLIIVILLAVAGYALTRRRSKVRYH